MDTPHKNITRALEALSPYLNNPRKTVIRIEAFVGLAVALLLLQFILGGWRRRSGHWSIQGGLWLCYTISFPLITYTIGLMVSSPIKNGLYPLWALLLFWASGCTNSVTVYALEDNKQWKRYLFEVVQYYAYSAVILQLLFDDTREQKTDAPSATIPLFLLIAVLLFTNWLRVFACMRVTDSNSSKVVADYMHAAYLRDRVGKGTLEIGIYPVRFNNIPTKGPNYTTELLPDKIITVDKIRKASQQFGDRENGVSSQWKDVCLSFALSELLKRRFYGMECAEANLPPTCDVFLNDLLELGRPVTAKDYTRAFEIIEVELGFLYDFFFTRYAVLAYSGMFGVIFMAALKLISISTCGVFLFRGFFTVKTSKPVIEVGTTTVDNTITVMIIGALCLIEVLQVILYVASDWTIVSLARSYIRGGTFLWNTILGGTSCKKIILSVISCFRRFNLSRTKFGKFLDRLNLFGYWQNKMGQSSVVEGFLHITAPIFEHRITIILIQILLLDTWLSVRYPRKTFLVVSDFVKSEIVSALKKHCERGGPLTNGKAALERDENFREFASILSTKDNDSQTMVMLIWHIATEYCRIASPGVVNQMGATDRDVATTLSKYCAYLMSFLPDLLPGNSTDTEFVNRAVLMEANELLRGKGPITKEILLKAIDRRNELNKKNEEYRRNGSIRNTTDQASTSNNSSEDNGDACRSIFIEGLNLGIALESKGADRWKVLAEFWAETIIFIAPSDNAKAHMERLAQGGEFLTHIWALLNHAGILTREQNLPPQVVPQP